MKLFLRSDCLFYVLLDNKFIYDNKTRGIYFETFKRWLFNIPCDHQMYVEPLSAPASISLVRQMPENFKLCEIAE